MKLLHKIWLVAGAVLLLTLVSLGFMSYRFADARVQEEVLKTVQTVRDLLMTVRYTYHQRFLASGLPLTDQTLGFLPAHAMGSISDDFQRFHRMGIRFRNVSDRARNPHNQADATEQAAIDWFRAHPDDKERLVKVSAADEPPFYFYATPIRVEAYCLTCHGERDQAPAAISQRYDQGFGYRIGELRGILGIRVPAAATAASIQAALGRELLIHLVGFMIALLVGGLLLQRLVVGRLLSYRESVRRMAAGDYGARLAPSGADEMADLATAFNAMAAAIQQRDQSLRDSEDKLHTLIQNIPSAVFRCRLDPAWTGIFVSEHIQALTGYPAGDFIGNQVRSYADLIHPDDADAVYHTIQEAVARGEPFLVQYRIFHTDGSIRWMEGRGQANFDPAGRVLWLDGTIGDISEVKQIQAVQERTAEFVSRVRGDSFFPDMVRHAATSLGLDYVHVALLSRGRHRVTTLAAWLDGQPVPNWSYDLANTPCERVLEHTRPCIESGVRALYPLDEDLARLGAESYVGEPLVDHVGQAVGLIVGVNRTPLANGELVQANLRILAARAAAELDQERGLRALRESEAKFHTMVDWTYDWEYWVLPDGGFNYISPSVERITGYPVEEFLRNPALIDAIVLPDDRHLWERHVHHHLPEGANQDVDELDFRIIQKQGAIRWVTHTCRPVLDKEGRYLGRRVTVRDITARKEAEEQIRHLAYFDPLTGLPNRRLLLDRLGHALIASARSLQFGALLMLDLDHFKTLNDTQGHEAGDRLLVEVARRLQAGVRQEDTVARLGGDEFLVMLADLDGEESVAAAQAEAIADKLREQLSQPYELPGLEQEYHSTPSIGLALFQGRDTSAEVLLKQADVALYQAKDAGRNTLRFFNPAVQAAIETRSALEADLRRGLARGELRLYYQPQVEEGRGVVGAEALLRWQHPERGMVPPAQFIPLAEETGLILDIGRWVLDSACAQLVAWRAQPGTRHLRLAINVSARQFHQPGFVEQVDDSLARSGADPALLKLELTESVVLDDVEEVVQRMARLKVLGVGFSLDDFGTGYSSLSYLKRLPLDQVKIDQSFVRDVPHDGNDAGIVRAILAMSESLGLQVIAEGVENQEQRDFLRRSGCLAYQGYLFGKPMPVTELEARLLA
ncbi:MAG: EAL domain-containing protein [Pseudomonadota bacterium]